MTLCRHPVETLFQKSRSDGMGLGFRPVKAAGFSRAQGPSARPALLGTGTVNPLLSQTPADQAGSVTPSAIPCSASSHHRVQWGGGGRRRKGHLEPATGAGGLGAWAGLLL